jgi:DNA-binding SARP family transcriptional activator
MHFNVLGSLEMQHDNHVCTPTAPKVRWVLALLLTRANQVVGVETVINELWGDAPPRSAVTTAQTYIYQLRQTFRRILGDKAAGELLTTRSPGYLLRIGPEACDATRFERMVEEGRVALDGGFYAEASRQLGEALALWRGAALGDVPAGRVLEAHVAHLEEMRLQALELRIQADLSLGRHRELIPELRSLVAAHPLNEWVHGQLINALNLSGRRSEALQAYQNLRRVLLDELGLEPSRQLQRLQRMVLNDDGPESAHAPVLALAGRRASHSAAD